MEVVHHFSTTVSPREQCLLLQTLIGSTTGFLSHWLYFIKNDNHHMRAPLYLRLYCLLALVLYALEIYLRTSTQPSTCFDTRVLISAYCGSLFTSIATYRYFFHRTRSFPGPRIAAITKFWHVWQARRSQNHLVLTALHEKYGDFVRTGPNEITIFHPDALNASNGPGSDCTKSNWYDFLQPQVALNTNRNVKEHEARRRLWKPSFIKESLDSYNHILIKYLNQLDQKIGCTRDQPLDVITLTYWWAFDVMGELTLSTEFNMLRSGEWHSAITVLRRFMALLGPFTPVPWLGRIGFSIPGMTRDWNKMVSFCKDQAKRRLAIQEPRSDICQPLIEHARQRDNLMVKRHYFDGDVMTMMIAGSDTVASTLVYTLYHLASESVYQTAILDEIEDSQLTEIHDIHALQSLLMLDAVIKETLRLHPPVVTGGPRDTGPDGLFVAGQRIPPYTTIIAPRYNIARLPTAFSNPNTFFPPRWLKDSPLDVHNISAFAPFGSGKYACIGRVLAVRQLKLTLAHLITNYEFKLVPGQDGTSVETDMRDQFTAVPGKLRLSFSRRQKRDETHSDV